MILKLELNKTYITDAFSPSEPDDGDIVTIVDIVDPNTVEYLRGYRYVAHNGMLYDDRGFSIDQDVSKYEILREATVEDLRTATEEYARMNLEDCEKSDKFIRYDDSRFFVGLGQIYVDRRGMFKFINKAYRFNDTDLWGPDGGSRFISDKEGYEPDGKENSGRLSMYDIVYQKIG